jgi:hypothetical protein
MRYTLGDAIEDTLKEWGIDEVPRDQNRKRFAEDVAQIYNKMQPKKSTTRVQTLEEFI